MKNGIYVSVWDGSTALESACLINETTHEITILETFNVDVDILETEYVIIDGVQFPACNADEYDGNGYYYN